MKKDKLYVFNGNNSVFPSGLFTEHELAVNWIKLNKLSGVLNVYPVNIGLYDWAIENNLFAIKNDNQRKPSFIERFSCAELEHYHFDNGELE
jgi:hypothetical protein